MAALTFKAKDSYRGATSPTWSVRPYGATTHFDESWSGTIQVFDSDKSSQPVLSAPLIRAVDGVRLIGMFSADSTLVLKPGKEYIVVFTFMSNSFGPLGSTKMIAKGSWTVR